MNAENWKSVPNFPRYEVSNLGRVRRGAKVMRPRIVGAGYLNVALYHLGERKSKLVHRLVAEAFCQRPPDTTEVNHVDGDKLNNRAENLEWTTRVANMRHAFAIGVFHERDRRRRAREPRTWAPPRREVAQRAIERARKVFSPC